MMFVVKAMVVGKDEKGRLLYRLYRCAYNGPVVQGTHIDHNEMIMCEALFPSLDKVGIPD